MELFHPSSIRTQLFTILLIVAFPAVCIIVYSGFQFRNQALDDARRDTRKLSDMIAAEQQNLVVCAEQLMMTLAQLPDVKSRDRARVEPVLRRLRALNPMYSNIFIADRSGTVWATAVPVNAPFVVADRRYFRNALAGGQLSSGEYVLSRATAHPAFNLACPLKDDRGAVTGVISVGFVIDRYRQLLERLQLPRGSSIVIMDHRGIILSRAIEPDKYIGKPYPPDIFRQMQQGPEMDTSIRTGAGGDRRVTSLRKLRLPGEQTPYMYVETGIPVDVALHEANRALAKNAALFMSFLCGASALAWLFGKHLISDRIDLLESAAQRLANGEHDIKISELVSGGELGRLGKSFDHMARKIALREEQLITSQKSYREVFDATKNAIFIHDAQTGRIVDTNRTAEQMYGYSTGEMPGLTVQDISSGVPPHTMTEALQRIQKAIQEGPQTFEWTGKRKDGNCFPTEVVLSKSNISGEERVLAVVRDITERKRAEDSLFRLNRALMTTNRCNETLVRATVERDLLTEICRNIVRNGEYRLAWVGYAHDDPEKSVEIAAKAGDELDYLDRVRITWDDSPTGQGPTGRAIRTGTTHVLRDIPADPRYAPWRDEATRRGFRSSIAIPLVNRETRLGALNIYSGWGEAFDDEEVRLLEKLADNLAHGIVSLRATHERNAALEERQKLEEQLMQAQKLESIGRLAGGVAHDFNNLLTPIMCNAELIRNGMRSDDPDYVKVDGILKAADRARVLTQQLLSFGRKQILEMKTIDLNSVLRSFHDILRRTIRENIEIRLLLTDDGLGIRADRHQLEQIIMNLAVNAQDAIDGNGVITMETSPITLDDEYVRQHSVVTAGNYLLLVFSDNGCGMDRQTLSHIFEPFYTTKPVGSGTGLGLAMVYGLVKQHDGYIEVHSQIGRGTTFKIYFPLVQGEPASESERKPETASPQSPLDTVGRTILLSEDDEMVRSMVADLLAGQGFRVIASDGPLQALRMSEGQDLDLLVTDVVMPGMSGPELHRRLLKTHQGLKVLYMSGYTSDFIFNRGVMDESIAFIQKPFAVNDLVDKVKQAFENGKEV